MQDVKYKCVDSPSDTLTFSPGAVHCEVSQRNGKTWTAIWLSIEDAKDLSRRLNAWAERASFEQRNS